VAFFHVALVSLAATVTVLTAAVAPAQPVISTVDVTRFYALYASTGGHPTAEELQRDYIDVGSGGLHRLATERRVTGASIAANLAKHPEEYMNAKRCMVVLPNVRMRLLTVFQTYVTLYPQAQFPPITIAVSRGKPAGIADESGVIIGLEALCGVQWMNPNMEERFVHIITHEYTHVQQALANPTFYNEANPTLLDRSLAEGAAEFMAELASGESGELAYGDFASRTRGHELAIDKAFVADENSTDLSNWIDNSTVTTCGDLGYWVGYRIVKSYYEHAANKRQAVSDIIQMNDPKAFLAESGWYPGIDIAIVRIE
jgi:hypothetical protein